MLNSVLLHLEGAAQARPVIRLGVDLARQTEARVRGLTLLDTRRMVQASHCESAVYALAAQSHQMLSERQQADLRADLSQACLAAGIDFDVRRSSGDPLQLLTLEARFHDLMVTSIAPANESSVTRAQWSLSDLIELLDRDVHPLLVAHENQATIRRVLLAYDGTVPAGRAIRSFLTANIFTQADHRLLAIGRTEAQARRHLREMADYCVAHRRPWEAGFVCGKLRRVLTQYAEKWQADLVVLGIGRTHRLLRRLLGHPSQDLLSKTPCAWYVSA
jgi:nucleotide-binding universal stress UspA family protein